MQAARSVLAGRMTGPLASSSKSMIRSPRPPSADRYLAIHAFFTRQSLHTTTTPRPVSQPFHRLGKRFKSTSKPDHQPCPNCPTTPPTPPPSAGIGRDHAQDYTPFIRRLIHRTQTISHNSPHRPTKEQLLAAASSSWERLRIRLKWFFIRGWRRFNTDDLSAFASWFVLGNSKYKPCPSVYGAHR